jgi:16S rRNA (guanine1207-N2)-methyltransferase
MGRSGAEGQDHYFSASPDAPSRPRTVTLTLPDLMFSLDTDAGVFAAEGVDSGTKYLLLENGQPPAGATDILDLGCGYGPIALTLASRAPEATIWAIDINERARELTRRNAAQLGLDNVRVSAPDEVPDDISFNAIYSNPPIRIGKAALHELLQRWLKRLDQAGLAVLVVNKNLGSDSLQRWLESGGRPTTRLSSRSGYRLLEVRPA